MNHHVRELQQEHVNGELALPHLQDGSRYLAHAPIALIVQRITCREFQRRYLRARSCAHSQRDREVVDLLDVQEIGPINRRGDAHRCARWHRRIQQCSWLRDSDLAPESPANYRRLSEVGRL